MSENRSPHQQNEITEQPAPIGQAFFRVMRAVMFEDEPIAALDALPLAQMRLFWTVQHTPDATMKDLSERLNVSQSTVTQLAERLVKRGLAERVPDPNDRRIVRLRLSKLGTEISGIAKARGEARHLAIWNRLEEAQREIVMQGLETLAEAAEALRRDEGHPHFCKPTPPPLVREETTGENSESVVDLLARRVRGSRPSEISE
jgi:DNA-binding MarR family transcriptional regulator